MMSWKYDETTNWRFAEQVDLLYIPEMNQGGLIPSRNLPFLLWKDYEKSIKANLAYNLAEYCKKRFGNDYCKVGVFMNNKMGRLQPCLSFMKFYEEDTNQYEDINMIPHEQKCVCFINHLLLGGIQFGFGLELKGILMWYFKECKASQDFYNIIFHHLILLDQSELVKWLYMGHQFEKKRLAYSDVSDDMAEVLTELNLLTSQTKDICVFWIGW